MFANTFVKNASSKMLLACAALLLAGFATLTPQQTAQAQSRSDYPVVKDAQPDGKDCFRRDGKRYCYKPEGTQGNLKAAPKDPQELKDCFWHVDKNGKKRLACIYYAF
ncbi:MAG: hypothetical protein HYR56_03125 [Acidobacteria bacterium]|nr:hypothetical protein [Acidobacteriota bacterium]MBI3423549.1 hypothetical protein [Acidobacteriota bacterium]